MTQEESIDEPGVSAAPKKKGGLAETTRMLAVLFILAIALRSLIVAPFSIPSGSMLPRMMIGDYLFVAKWPYGFSRFSFPFGILAFNGRLFSNTAERGDIAVFRYPGSDKDYVKRVIGLPGDMIQMRGGTLYLNGEPVPKTQIADLAVPLTPNSPCRTPSGIPPRVAISGGARVCLYPRYRETLPGGRSYEILDQGTGPADDTVTFLVPEEHVFMMGDNRDDSEDSRFARAVGGVEMLPQDHLIGRALVTFFSTDGSAEWLKPWTWFTAVRWERIGGTY